MNAPAKPLKVLIAEDNPDDEALLLRHLRRAGYEVIHRRVDNEADYRRALEGEWDLVLSDYQMPQFTGMRALEVLQALGHPAPFIIVSGTIGEDTAVAVMRQGATDYLLKDRLARLGPAVDQAVSQGRLRRERQEIERDFQLLFARNPMPMWVYELEELQFVAVNDAAVEHYGYTREEFLRLGLKDIRPPEDVARMLVSVRSRPPGITHAGIWRHRKKDGTEILVDTTAQRTTFLGHPAELVMASDVTLRVASEKALRESEARLRLVTETAQVGLVMIDADHCYRYANPAYGNIFQLSSQELLGRPIADVLPALYASQIKERLQRAFAGDRLDYELVTSTPEGERRHAVSYRLGVDEGHLIVIVVFVDVTALRQADLKIREQVEELLRWQETMLDREDRVLQLKAEVNAILQRHGEVIRYLEAQS
jgi:two-component system sensor histidine kinase/response regulator